MTFTRSTRTFSWTPSGAACGKIYYVKFIVTTLSGGTDVVLCKITVNSGGGLSSRPAVEEGRGISLGPNPTHGAFAIATSRIPGVIARLQVLDVSGRIVREVRATSGGPVVWDGRGADGLPAPSGVYLYQLGVGPRQERGRVVGLR